MEQPNFINMTLNDIIKIRNIKTTFKKKNGKLVGRIGVKNGWNKRKQGQKTGGFKNRLQNNNIRNNGFVSKLLISNLHFDVSLDDVEQLFSEYGRLRKAELYYSENGCPTGTAAVIFENRSDALRAVNRYHGEVLDGRTMVVELVSKKIIPTNNRMANGGRKPFKKFNRNGGGNNNKKKQNIPTAEQLDAELESIINARDNHPAIRVVNLGQF